jgi:hypothetical protein
MIFGLVVSTGLTLFVIPSLYVLMVDRAGMKVSMINAAGICADSDNPI